MGPQDLTAAISGFALGDYGAMIVKVMFWLFLGLMMGIVLYVGYVFLTFKVKATVYHVTGAGDGITIGKKTWDRVRPNRDGSWTWLRRMYKREEAFPYRYVYPGNRVVAFRVGEQVFPGRFDFDGLDDVQMTPVPFDIRRKVELELQQIELDLQKQDWWSQGGKQMLIALGMTLMVIGFAAFVIWLAFAKTNTLVPQLERLTAAMTDFGTIK